ncbi:MAG: hypothetical protein GY702_26220, partial [Desulfobulbaceae bacterium]|nr:hypothetical protein [Desulfobulbaceae bacterium]
KKITGRSKLASTVNSEDTPKESLDLVTPSKKPTLKAYRLYEDDIARLKEITATMNKESHRHVSETAAIRALLVLGTSVTGERLINALRKTL